jgi:tight adherence protein B
MDVLLVGIGCAAGILLVVAIYSFCNDLSARQATRVESAAGGAPGRSSFPAFPPAFDFATSATTPSRRSTLKWLPRLRLWIDQSGVDIRPTTLIGLTCLIGVIPAVLAGLLSAQWWWAVAAYFLPAVLPSAFVAFQRRRRSNRLREQLPDALDLMSRMLRAGQTIPQSLRGVADEFEAPIAEEFGYCYEQQNLGLSTDASMYEMARRTGVLELRILVVALTVHRHTGGNLSELLDNLAAVVRERYRIYGQIRALTADGRMQAAILLALPPFLLVVLSFLNRDYITILYQFPWLLVGMFAFELIGALWLRRIVSFDF